MVLLVASTLVHRRRARGLRAAAGRHRVPRGRLRADGAGAQHVHRRVPPRPRSTGRCSCSTPCSGSAPRWRRCSSPSSSASASGGACRCSSAVLLVGLLVVSLRLPLHDRDRRADHRADAGRRGGRSRAGSGSSPRSRSLYGICETMNGNWSQLDMTSELGASTDAGLARPDHVLGDGDRRPRRCSPRSSGGSRRTAPTTLLPFVLAGALVADRRAARAASRRRRARVRAGRPGLLGAAAADDQLRPGGARRDVGGGRRRGSSPCYQLGYGIAAFGAGPLQDAGVTLPTIFAVAAGRRRGDGRPVVRHQPPRARAPRAASATGLTRLTRRSTAPRSNP